MTMREVIEGKIQTSDWRGIIAITLVVGFLILLWNAKTESETKTISSILSGPIGLIVDIILVEQKMKENKKFISLFLQFLLRLCHQKLCFYHSVRI